MLRRALCNWVVSSCAGGSFATLAISQELLELRTITDRRWKLPRVSATAQCVADRHRGVCGTTYWCRNWPRSIPDLICQPCPSSLMCAAIARSRETVRRSRTGLDIWRRIVSLVTLGSGSPTMGQPLDGHPQTHTQRCSDLCRSCERAWAPLIWLPTAPGWSTVALANGGRPGLA